MIRIERRAVRYDRPGWGAFLAGAAAGVAASLLAVRLRSAVEATADDGEDGAAAGGAAGPEGGSAWSRLRDAWDGALEGASEGFASARQIVTPEERLDADALRGRLAGLDGASDCRLRVLSEGIVEVVGSCSSDAVLRGILDELAAVPGVEVVVNRVWTPDSGSSTAPGWPRSPH